MVGSSANEVAVKMVLDATVGGLVWVRRKNGSWWPGQIVGSEELCEIDLATPRSGTPIKLLGREDTSVDWFDLETTKAVKAFRCGEYDTCIEKAKLSVANKSLKFTKYPRRENAIVCALEIEKNCMLKDCPDSDKWHGEYSSEETSSEETISASEEISNSTTEVSYSGVSCEETNGSTHINGLQCRGRKRKTPNDSEDDGYEGIKRMKGLNDLGLTFEKKEPTFALPDSSQESTSFLNNLCDANGMSMRTLANGSSTLTLKKKSSQVVHIHELLTREYPRRPIKKVLENTTMVPVQIICDKFANPFERSDVVSSGYECDDSNNTNKLKSAKLSNWLPSEDDSSDILVDVPFVDGELHSSGFSPACRSSFGHEAPDEPGLAYSAGYFNQKVEKSASKWQSKGKRNARHLGNGEKPHSRGKLDIHYRLDPYMTGHENGVGRFSPSSNGVTNGFTDCRNHDSMTFSQRSSPYHQSQFLAHANFEMADISPRSSDIDSLLYEVEVTVEATRSKAQHVPYISLTSKINGKPITGHPLAVEVLEDGYCNLESSDYPPSDSCQLYDEETDIKVTVEPKSHKKKKSKLRSHFRRRKSSKSKKRNGSSKKTRRLSALTGAHKLSLVKGKPMSQSSKGPTLACIPLKVVFSRINEALNGSRSTHRVSNT